MQTRIISFQQIEQLSVVQLATDKQNTFNYISLSNAIKENFAAVEEITKDGIVNNLILVNNSEHYIFASDGDVLIGAKQNRVLNTSILVPPNSKTIIPVSCIEQGRWRYESKKFDPADYLSPVEIRMAKSQSVFNNLKTNDGHFANQRKVWDEVKNISHFFKVFSDTMDLDDVFIKEKGNIDSIAKKFTLSEQSNGLAIFINDNFQSIDIYNRTDIFSEYFHKQIKSAFLNSIRTEKQQSSFDESRAIEMTFQFLDKLNNLHFNIFNGVGVGEEKRFSNDEITGFILTYKEEMIHTSVLKSLGGKYNH
ncbi:MAG: hypothetical protein QHH13_04220 [Melioribacter sp.]|uniref:ARPP-1 family domain-containing protein n=1 Tax=Rosettibacter primus TaxID=3111523 RepID=UPI00247B9BB1|nr:hypothetical protein [Melioribacter sp.]